MEKEDLGQKKDLKDEAEDITSHIGDYVNTFFKLTVLKATQKAANIASALFAVIVVCIMSFFVILFASFGLAWWLGDIIKSRAGGFIIVAGFYFLLAICLLLFRKKIIFPLIRNLIIRKIYE
jgi:hypothetical protein